MLTLLTSAIRFTFCFCVALPEFYLLASLWEGTFHEVILDRPWFTKLGGYRRDGWLSELWFARFSHHVVHHHLTYRRSYIEQFHSPAYEQSLREKLSRRLDTAQFRSVIASRFGTSFTWSGARQFALPLLLAGLAAVWLCPGEVPRAAMLMALLLGTLPYFVFSKWVHPYLHLPFDRVPDAPTILRGLLQSRYGLAMRIGHFVCITGIPTRITICSLATMCCGDAGAPPVRQSGMTWSRWDW